MIYYRVSDSVVVEISEEQFAALASVKQALHRPYKIAPIPALTSTQRAEIGPIVVTDDAATRTWNVVNKTQAELDEEAEAAQRSIDYAQAKTIFNDLKSGTGTAGERLARVEKVVARLLRDTLLARGL